MIQSFLILGQPEKRREKTLELLKNLDSKFSKNSPDITLITPIKKTTTIDQIRDVKQTIYQKPLKLFYKFVIFENASTLNRQAQNALLKILEEPPIHAIIILEAREKSGLLPTLISRVATLWAKSPNPASFDQSLLDVDQAALLGQIGSIENEEEWLDNQMLALANQLEQNIKREVSVPEFSQIISAIESCKDAKKMIMANVNPKFVLINLVLSQS